MMLRELLKEMLASNTGVTSVVGQKFFTMRAPQGTAPLYSLIFSGTTICRSTRCGIPSLQ